MSEEKDRVGFGRPPRDTQFKRGQSGNPKGRPRKRPPTELDLDALLAPVTVNVGGKACEMQPKEVSLRKLLDKAIKKEDLKAIAYLMDEFHRYGAIEPPKRQQSSPVVVLPKDLPYRVGHAALSKLGLPPWTDKQLAPIKAEYLLARSEADRIYDEIVGYDL